MGEGKWGGVRGGGGGRGRRVSLPDPTSGAVIIFLFCLLSGKKKKSRVGLTHSLQPHEYLMHLQNTRP